MIRRWDGLQCVQGGLPKDDIIGGRYMNQEESGLVEALREPIPICMCSDTNSNGVTTPLAKPASSALLGRSLDIPNFIFSYAS